MRITKASLRVILDSRGEKTLEACFTSGKYSATASVPRGESRGAHEAFLKDPDRAVPSFPILRRKIEGREFHGQKEFDRFLIRLDGTPNKRRLGGNVTLVLSLAWARLKAKEERKELHSYIRSNYQLPIANYQSPRLLFNVINGGLHATHPKSRLTFQEFIVIPKASKAKEALRLGKKFYRLLEQVLRARFGKELYRGDEAGFSAPFQSNEEALDFLAALIQKYRLPFRLGLDCAATGLQVASNKYQVRSKRYRINGRDYARQELVQHYLKIIRAHNLLSIEDPFAEEDFTGFAELRALVGQKILVVADDLTTTNPRRLGKALSRRAGNAIIIKPNQIGTLTETLTAVRLARQGGWRILISHRSGETQDAFIADLAVGVGAWGLKSGAPASPERLAKYERLVKIEAK